MLLGVRNQRQRQAHPQRADHHDPQPLARRDRLPRPRKQRQRHEADHDSHERDAIGPDGPQAFGYKEERGAPDQAGNEDEQQVTTSCSRGPRMMHPHQHPGKPVGPLSMRLMLHPRLEPILPDPACREVYDGLYRRHRALYAALRPLFSAAH